MYEDLIDPKILDEETLDELDLISNYDIDVATVDFSTETTERVWDNCKDLIDTTLFN